MPFVATWMDSEIVILSEEVRHRKKNIYYMWNLRKMNLFTNELIYKTEIESQMQKTNLRLPEGRWGETGVVTDTLEAGGVTFYLPSLFHWYV